MRARGQALAALLVLAVVAGGAVALDRGVGARPPGALPPGEAPSGAWLCPHGGGRQWVVTLALGNPGEAPVDVRLTPLSAGGPGEARSLTVPGGGLARIEVPAGTRGASTFVEYFGGWVAAGWVARAGGRESGVAAEPCLAEGGQRFLLPDGETDQGHDTYVVVMNPYASEAVVTLTLLTEERVPITHRDWANLVLSGGRSVAFHVNEKVLGERTVAAVVDVAVGRVGAASLVVSTPGGGVRSVVGAAAPAVRSVLPGAGDTGESDLVLLGEGDGDARFSVASLEERGRRLVGDLEAVVQRAASARTYPVLAEGPAALEVDVEAGAPPLATVRRTFGVGSDPGALGGASPGPAWVVLPAVAGEPSHPRLVLVNPGREPAWVVLRFLPPQETALPAAVTLRVPPGSAVTAPRSFVEALPEAAVLAVARSGTFVPAAASSSLGRLGLAGYAVSLGVEVPPGAGTVST